MKIFKKIRYESGLRRVLVFNKELIRYVSNKSDRLEKYNNSWFITDYMKYNGFLSCQKK